MAKMNIIELASFEVADIDAEGAMPDSGFESAYGMKEGSSNINVGEPESNDFYVEESTLPFASSEGNREADLTVELVGVDGEVLAPLLGGNYVAADATSPEKIEFASGSAAVYRAVKMTGKNSDGDDVVISIPKARMLSSFTGVIGRGDLRGWALRGKIQTPVNTSGEAQNYLIIELGSPSS